MNENIEMDETKCLNTHIYKTYTLHFIHPSLYTEMKRKKNEKITEKKMEQK